MNYPGVWARVSYVLDWIEDNADVNSEYGCMDVAACNYSDEAIYNVPEACVYEIDECGDCGGDGPAPGYDCDGNCVTGETLVVEWDSPVYIRRENPTSAIIAQLDSKPRIMGNSIIQLSE